MYTMKQEHCMIHLFPKAIHSITACDLGMEKEAYEMFMSAALTDLGQEMKSSDAGIHSANMGGVWQDVVMGFGGIRIRDGHLRIAPNCPKQWEKIYIPGFIGKEINLMSQSAKMEWKLSTRAQLSWQRSWDRWLL